MRVEGTDPPMRTMWGDLAMSFTYPRSMFGLGVLWLRAVKNKKETSEEYGWTVKKGCVEKIADARHVGRLGDVVPVNPKTVIRVK